MSGEEEADEINFRLLRTASSSLSSLLNTGTETPQSFNHDNDDSDSDYASDDGVVELSTIASTVVSTARQGLHYISTTIFRVTNYSSVSELIQSADMGAFLFAVGGAWLGKRLRRQFSTLWLMTTAGVFAGKLLIELGYVTVHWDRIAEARQKYPIVDRCVSGIPTAWAVVKSATAGTWFATGFLLGFRYGFPYGL